jgi:hypothetical protein
MKILPIPDSDNVFRRLMHFHWNPKTNKVKFNAFSSPKSPYAISVEWERYIKEIADVRDRMAIAGKKSLQETKNNKVGKLLVKKIRKQNGIDVRHAPTKGNKAHSNIIINNSGCDLLEQRVFLADICEIVL